MLVVAVHSTAVKRQDRTGLAVIQTQIRAASAQAGLEWQPMGSVGEGYSVLCR